ncbi:hypothetical protein K458DRAFT_29813 [Lentithecium fluviatile CBS 122367]|uniref:Uncharacterized protein n=1 Tax=Lentithecium fluviatile CBS 122367 TaxID=1168545 RepID=A0A6G1J195_9PLEO|nr:hypothetical protein K458DRAFT_29813 [Lentithecium fluviatile CBS 122367]
MVMFWYAHSATKISSNVSGAPLTSTPTVSTTTTDVDTLSSAPAASLPACRPQQQQCRPLADACRNAGAPIPRRHSAVAAIEHRPRRRPAHHANRLLAGLRDNTGRSTRRLLSPYAATFSQLDVDKMLSSLQARRQRLLSHLSKAMRSYYSRRRYPPRRSSRGLTRNQIFLSCCGARDRYKEKRRIQMYMCRRLATAQRSAVSASA